MTRPREMQRRWWTSDREMPLEELVGTIREMQREHGLADDHPTRVSRGVFVRWESLETDEEYEKHLALEEDMRQRRDKWERETYDRLFTKYAGLPPSTIIGGVPPV